MFSQREELLNWDKREKKSKIYFIWGKESMNEKLRNVRNVERKELLAKVLGEN